jgi:hypothetical protein
MNRDHISETELFRRIQDHAVRRLSWAASARSNLHIQREVLKRGAVIKAYQQKIPVRRNAVMVFADDAPLLNWGHPCRYILYDARNGQPYDEVPAQFPPYLTDVPESFRLFHEPVPVKPVDRLWYIRPRLRCPIRVPRGQRYAVLFSGASNNRHTNDLEFLYRTLRDLYGLADDHIYCLNYDGTINYSGGPKPVSNWPGDNTPYRMPLKGSGTKADLDGVLDDLKKRLKSQDFLLIHTNNHGGYAGPGQAYLVTYSGPSHYANDFANKLAQLPKFHCLMVMMEQCHSGGFNAPILAKSTATYTSVSSACLEPNNSIGGAQWDPFARDWISAMSGHTPSGGTLAFNPDADADGKVEAKEAHDYADAVHDPYDTPVYSENDPQAGRCHLGQRYVWWWWWFCPIVIELLEPHYIRLPIPEFWDRYHRFVAPRLEAIQRVLERDDKARRIEVERRVKAIIEKAF